MSQQLWAQAEPRAYERRVDPVGVARSILMAFVLRLPGLRAIAQRCGQWLKTDNPSNVSNALRRPAMRRLMELMIQTVTWRRRPHRGEWVALDSMAVTLPSSQRHGCKKFNNRTVGGGVLWACAIKAGPGVCPIEILKMVEGAWHDSRLIRAVALRRRGPIYLMDRGFYALDLIQGWVKDKVRFIVRARQKDLRYQVLKSCGPARDYGQGGRIELDCVAQLGGPQAKAHPIVRLVIATLGSGQQLALVSGEMDMAAEAILNGYKQRWQIERFHRFLKQTVGLAHLYSFQQAGLTFLIQAVVLLALLMLVAARAGQGQTVDLLMRLMTALRRSLGLATPWRPNTVTVRRKKKHKNL